MGSDIVNVFLSHAYRVAENCQSYQMQSAVPKEHAGIFTEALTQPVVLNDGLVFHPAAGRAFVASHEESVLMVAAVAVEAAPTASANASNITFTRAVAFLTRAPSSVVQT
jgi:hypothetical protein